MNALVSRCGDSVQHVALHIPPVHAVPSAAWDAASDERAPHNLNEEGPLEPFTLGAIDEAHNLGGEREREGTPVQGGSVGGAVVHQRGSPTIGSEAQVMSLSNDSKGEWLQGQELPTANGSKSKGHEAHNQKGRVLGRWRAARARLQGYLAGTGLPRS